MKISGDYCGRIKNWVSAQIAVHKAIADAHHAKYTDGEVDTIVAAHNTSIPAHAALSGFSVKFTAVQAIPTTEWTDVLWTSELFDLNNEFADNRFTAKTAGYYILTADIAFVNLSDGNRWVVQLTKNGVGIALTRGYDAGAVGDTYNGGCVAIVAKLIVGDYIKVRVYHDHGSNINMHGVAGYNSFSGGRVG